jgi:hypothetical protein
MSGSSLLSEQLAQAISSSSLLARLVSTAYSGVEAQAAVFQQKLQGFPVQGNSYIILSSGIAAQAPGNATRFVSVNMGGISIPGGSPDGFNAHDVATLTLRLNLAGLSPIPAPKLVFYFKFCTDENLSFVESAYQDYFTAYVKDSSGNPITNVALVPSGKPVTVRNADPYSNDVKGTSENPLPPFPFPDDVAYNACTQLLGASFDLLPFIGQEILIEFQVGDASDPIYDSAVFIDGLDIIMDLDIDLSPGNIEVNQAIQKPGNSIPLVAGKRAVVRAYVNVAGTPSVIQQVKSKKISAELYVFKDGQEIPGSPFLPEARGYGQRTREISDLIKGEPFDFYFDGHDGPVLEVGTYQFQVKVDIGNVIPERDETNNASQVQVQFQDTQELRVLTYKFIPLSDSWPSNDGIIRQKAFLLSTYPIAPRKIVWLDQGLKEVKKNIKIEELFKTLDKERDLYNIENDPDAQLIVGFVVNIDIGAEGLAPAPGSASLVKPIIDPPIILAHEMGHNLLGKPFPSGSKCKTYEDKDGAHQHNKAVGSGAFDVRSRKEIPSDTTYDFMGYCGPFWVAENTYSFLYDKLKISTSTAAPNLAAFAIQEYLVISGTIGRDDTLELGEFYRLTGVTTPTIFTGGPYKVELRDGNQTVLSSYSFDLDFTIGGHLDLDRAPFSFVVPYPAATRFIVFSRDGNVIGTRSVSANNPSVNVTSPNGGEFITGTHTITWTASDPDGDSLTYSVFYSPDGGSQWFPIASGLTETAFSWDTTGFPGSSNGLIRVIASDGVNTGQDESNGPFTVGKKPPIVTILEPQDNATIIIGDDPVVLQGAANDLEDGILTGVQLRWNSSIDGDLGTGELLVLPTLSIGTHTVTLIATDNDGNSVSDSILITVSAPDTQPPNAPTGLIATPKPMAIDLTWNPNTESDLAGYKVYYGTLGSGNYQGTIDVGNVTSYRLQNLTPGTTYYIAVTAYDTVGNESAPSNEVIVIPLVEPRIEGTATAFNSTGQPIVVVQLNSSLPAVVPRPKGGTRTDCQSQSPIQFCRTLPKQVKLNQAFTIKLTLKNIGSSTLARVRMEDILPSNVQLVSGKLVKECRNLRKRATCSNTYRVKVISASATADQMVVLQVLGVEGLSARDGTIRFLAQGEGIKDIQIAVFDLSGRLIFNSDWVANNFLWNGQNMRGKPLANGVYLYVVRVRGFDGREYVSEVRKLVIVR